MSKHNKGGWGKQIKNDPNFFKTHELNTSNKGGTWIARTDKPEKDTGYHPSNTSYTDFGNLAYEGSADDL